MRLWRCAMRANIIQPSITAKVANPTIDATAAIGMLPEVISAGDGVAGLASSVLSVGLLSDWPEEEEEEAGGGGGGGEAAGEVAGGGVGEAGMSGKSQKH